MHLRNLLLKVKVQKQLVLTLISLILGLAFLDLVPIAQTGLDPSWQIALTKSHFEGRQWGGEIIFTYGPLGYLFFGSLLDKTFLEMQIARYIVSFFWAFLSLRFIFRTQNIILQLVKLVAFILIPLLANNPETKFILIIQLLIIDISLQNKSLNAVKSIHIKSYLYGVISIFFLLIKFNFGLLAVSCCLLITLCDFAVGRLNREKRKINHPPFSLNWLLLGYSIGLLIFISPLIQQPYFALLISCCTGIVVALILARQPKKFDNTVSNKLISLSLILLIISLISIHPQIRDFIVGSLEITKGYSQSMTLIGNINELTMGWGILSGILMLGISAIFFDIRNTGCVISLLIFALMNFKHGFIRHDGHVLSFALTAPAYLASLGSLLVNQELNRNIRAIAKSFWLFFVILSLTFVFGLGMKNSALSKYYDFTPVQPLLELTPSALMKKLDLLIHPQFTEDMLIKQKTKSLLPSQITIQKVLSTLRGKSVDVQPWEVSLIEANKLKWNPAPIFQTYSVYTRWLDHKNLTAYQTHPPNKILYSFGSIDFRHPYFDQPQTTLFIRCQYEQQKNIKPFVLKSTGELVILKKRKTPLCNPENMSSLGQPVKVAWDTRVGLKQWRKIAPKIGHILILKLDIQYSYFGKIYNALFRTPPVQISVQRKTGQKDTYRFVLDTAKSGLIIGDLPTTLQDALNDFDGFDSSNPVQSILVSTPHQKVFKDKIEMSFWDLKKQASLPKRFNTARYLELNSDIKAAGVDPKQHYLEFGFFEGRRYE